MSNFFFDNISTHPHVSIGEMNAMCVYCKARKFPKEPPGMCCSSGRVILQPLNDPPEPLLSLMTGASHESKHFLTNICKYNSCFKMTSFGATKIINDGFMPTFKVQGQIYHRIGSLLPSENDDYKFLQIYFMGDKEEESNRRCNIIGGTRHEIITILQELFHTHNNVVKMFKTAFEKMPSNNYQVVIRADKKPPGEHERRFNTPMDDEIAVVMIGTEFGKRDIVVEKRNTGLKRVSETHRLYDALQYPIIFWNGEEGYNFNVMQIDPKTGDSTSKKVSIIKVIN